MSTSGNQRMTRSASKARSTGGASTGAASVGASSRGRSRRVGSAAPLAEEDKPSVGNQVTRAYGTEGRSAQAQLLSAQIGMNQAVNPIADAVSNAQAPETPPANTSGRLPALSEEPEASEEGSQPFVDRMPYTIQRRPYSIDSVPSEPPAQQQNFFSRYFWGPRRGGFDAEGPNRTSNHVIQHKIREHIDGTLFPPEYKEYHIFYPWSWTVLIKDAMLILVLLIALLWFYEVNRTRVFGLGAESEFSQYYNNSSLTWRILDRRVWKLEKNMHDRVYVDAATPKHQINWLTPGFGTGIDLYLSSPTVSTRAICTPSWWPWSMFTSQNCPEILLSAPQYAALSPWDDPVDDAWCAPPSSGKLQLTVALSRTIVPTELVVEHGAKDEMPIGFMGSSPREVELWIHIPDDRTRAAVREAITIMDPSLLDDSSPQGKTLGEAQALPFDYVPVGRWEYNIYTNQRLQTFHVPFSLAQYGVSTQSVAVRVNSNWGNSDFTCLCRLRLYGEDTSGMMEKLDLPPVGRQ